MSCITLFGGGIGCGKSTLINYILKHKTDLFGENIENTGNEIDQVENERSLVNFCVIQFDNLCSIEEQEHLMKSVRGLRNFRADLLMAAERLITLTCDSESSLAGPLTERSYQLFLKLKSINNGLTSSNTIFLVEDNFYYRSMRYDWFQIARRTNLGFATVFLYCPLNIAMDRNAKRGYQIPEDRIKKMLSFIEFPEPAKFKWEKLSVSFDSSVDLSNTTLVDVIDVIKEAMKNPVELLVSEDKIEARKICSKNVIHQSDRILRKIVSKIISNLKVVYSDEEEEENFKIIISNLVNVRQKLLSDIKQGNVSLPEDLVEKIQNLGIESVLDVYEERLQKLFNTILEETSMDLNVQVDDSQLHI